MVCVLDESKVTCVVRDGLDSSPPFELHVSGSLAVGEFVRQVAHHYSSEPHTFELIYTRSDGSDLILSESSEGSLQTSGIKTDGSSRNLFVVKHNYECSNRQNDLAKKQTPGDKRSEVNKRRHRAQNDHKMIETFRQKGKQIEQEIPYNTTGLIKQDEQEIPYNTTNLIKQDTGYVGLVNQAMTCYLNSLLQALYMTPEFRNALYKWQYIPEKDKDNDSAKCIPYQLQKLFLNLQTSQKSAVETTELTRSFGWDSSEAWQQHDIQELCRVMFDALEHTFKNTDQADLIDRLYQGKMLDYVKCLECGKEKSRKDTFLDIPLPVRPFGSTVAYRSIEEALKAFVQPETLEGANQYFCESCNKKCDAHKGLKFTKFPYLLTLHLKRFDFDYSTMHRIKLNDKVTFPETLYLNEFIEQDPEQEVMQVNEKEEGSEGLPEELAVSKCDDSSTTDSGSALDDEAMGCQNAVDLPLSTNNMDMNQDDDEGIDVSGGNGSNHHENEKNRQHGQLKGPYEYELFSIMIHSGSASGGHYYAYIKDFSNGEWFCFNDTSVSRITKDDIAKTYGGGALRSYYSGAYSSSTNAYMLMYRQKNETLNCSAMKIDNFPDHIKNLYKELQEKQDIMGKYVNGMSRFKVYCQHPKKGMTDVKLYVHDDSTFSEVTEQAYEVLKLSGEVDPCDCRLVSYNYDQDAIEVSFEGREKEMFLNVVDSLKNKELLFEIKRKDEEFVTYQPGGLTVKAFWVDVEKEEIELPPIIIRSSFTNTVAELKASIAAAPSVNMSADNVVVLTEKYPADHQVLSNDQDTLQEAGFYQTNKVYACAGPLEKPFANSKVHVLIDRFEHVITLHFTLPDTDPDTLARMSIPSLSSLQITAGKQAGDSSTPPPLEKVTAESTVKVGSRGLMLPLILTGAGDEESGGAGSSGAGGGHSDQSASEDSSLTDSDRTLIGDVQDECLSEGENQLASPPEEEQNAIGLPVQEEDWDNEPVKQYTYFKAEPYEADSKKMLKVRVDKRMSIENVKSRLEPLLGVPATCFKLLRTSDCESSRTRTLESLSMVKNEDTVNIRLGRQLTSDEHKVKIHQLVLNSSQPVKFLCDWIIGRGTTVGQTKREVIEEVNKRYNMNLQFNKCRLRKKNWKNVGRIYLDSQVWVDEVTVYSNADMFLQELSEPEPATSATQVSLFVRQWHPSTLTLDPFQEVLLDSFSFEELRQKLSEIASIPVENIDIDKPSGLFPCDMSVLNISELDWNPKCSSLEAWPLQYNEDGGVLFFKDNREELKELSGEERLELAAKEAARLNSSSVAISGYSPRKERPLKIYLNRRPSPAAEADID